MQYDTSQYSMNNFLAFAEAEHDNLFPSLSFYSVAIGIVLTQAGLVTRHYLLILYAHITGFGLNFVAVYEPMFEILGKFILFSS